MTGREMYEITRAESARLAPLEAGVAALPPWEELPDRMKAAWEQKAIDQEERDYEPGRARDLNNYGGLEV